jgi:hypothetical protein
VHPGNDYTIKTAWPAAFSGTGLRCSRCDDGARAGSEIPDYYHQVLVETRRAFIYADGVVGRRIMCVDVMCQPPLTAPIGVARRLWPSPSYLSAG